MEDSFKPFVFISYSHCDFKHLGRLKVHLKSLEADGLIVRWDDSEIQSGDDWRKKIENALGRANIAILLVSADFVASTFIGENELPPLLEAAKKRGVRILWVYLSPCNYDRLPQVASFQAVKTTPQLKAISDMSFHEAEALWLKLCKDIEKILKQTSKPFSRDGLNKVNKLPAAPKYEASRTSSAEDKLEDSPSVIPTAGPSGAWDLPLVVESNAAGAEKLKGRKFMSRSWGIAIAIIFSALVIYFFVS